MNEDRTIRMTLRLGKKCSCCGRERGCFRLGFRKYICTSCAAEACGMSEFEFSMYRVR